MSEITEKVAYLKGLVDGQEVDLGTKEGKLLKATMEILADLAESVTDLEETVAELGEQVDEIDEDLDELECEYYGEDEDECDCDDFYDITCPACSQEFSVDEETLLEGGIECPECGEHLDFDIDEEDECECCDH